MENLNRKIALATSYALHPLFMPTNGLLLVYFIGRVQGFNIYSSEADKEIIHFVILIVFIATGVIPVIIASILKKLKIISSLNMPAKEERMIPFLLTGVAYLTTIFLFNKVWKLPLDPLIFQFMNGATLAILLGMMITLNWKISVHMIGIGGVTGIVFLLSKLGDHILFYTLIATLISAAMIAFGRLNLKAHTLPQVIAGFLLGFVCEIIPLLVR